MIRGVLWFLGLAASAVVLALGLGTNGANVSLFWPPYRVDVSFNLLLLLLLLWWWLWHMLGRGWRGLRSLPGRAQRWRTQQLERAAQSALLQAWLHQRAGRYVRAHAAARETLAQLAQLGPDHVFEQRDALRWLAGQLQAESAHELGNWADRDQALELLWEDHRLQRSSEARAGVALSAATWALEQRDAPAASRWLQGLPSGAGRRIHALRLRLRLARLQQRHSEAMELVRALTKHRAYSATAAASLLRALVLESLRLATDRAALRGLWQGLQDTERRRPELALACLERWDALPPDSGPEAGDVAPPWLAAVVSVVWDAYPTLAPDEQRRFCLGMGTAWLAGLGAAWLARLEQAQQERPQDWGLQYLVGQACWHHQLWGKAGHWLAKAVLSVPDAELKRQCWCRLATLAEQRGDDTAAQTAWKNAALA